MGWDGDSRRHVIELKGSIMRRLSIVGAVLVAALVMTSTALAAITVKQLPTISFNGDSATVSGGNFSGLGNTPLYGNLTVTGIANYECQNPNGNPSPGQNPVQAQSGSSGPVQLPTDKNGRATVPNITATVSAPPTPSATEVGCGGGGAASQGKWTVVLTSLQATAAHFVVTQGNPGPVVFCRNYTLNGPATGTAC
jgi:hypothetical protein